MNVITEHIKRRPRIFALNMMRVFIIAAVIATHTVSSGAIYDSTFSGVVWMISHTSRNLFVFITALVLMYNYGFRKKLDIKAFYLKRFTFVIIPYAAWTLIYQIKDGISQSSFADFAGVYLHNFVTAGAMYHLYFLLITMQVYLFFPLIHYVYRKIKTSPKVIFAVSLGLQLVITAFMQYAPDINGFEWWLNDPDNYILGYQFYIVSGILLAANFDTFMERMRMLRKRLYAISAGASVVGIALYLVQTGLGAEPAYAAAVFQPYLVVTSALYGMSLIGFSAQWVKNGMKFSKPIAAISEDSFGIYLSHVLFITYYARFFQPPSGHWYVGLATVVIGIPVFYSAGFVLTEVARRTWLSIPLTGRRMTPLHIGFPFKPRPITKVPNPQPES